MKEVYPLGAMSSTGSLRVAEIQDSSSYLNRSLRSVASASIRVGHLVTVSRYCRHQSRPMAAKQRPRSEANPSSQRGNANDGCSAGARIP
jgi:hypothetical protein